jgi:hypothetical protein
VRHAEQAVRLARHGTDDQHDLVALTLLAQRALGNVAHPFEIRYRCSAEFLDDESQAPRAYLSARNLSI